MTRNARPESGWSASRFVRFKPASRCNVVCLVKAMVRQRRPPSSGPSCPASICGTGYRAPEVPKTDAHTGAYRVPAKIDRRRTVGTDAYRILLGLARKAPPRRVVSPPAPARRRERPAGGATTVAGLSAKSRFVKTPILKPAFTSHPVPGKPASFRGPLGAMRLHIQRAVLSGADTQNIKGPGGDHHDQEIDG